MWPFCKHEWAVVNEVILPSAFEQTIAAGRPPSKFANGGFGKTHAVIIACTKCGKLHREVTENMG